MTIPDKYIERARNLVSQGREPQAISELTFAINEAPLLPLYCERARLFASVGDLASAINDLSRAIQIDPHHAEARMARGRLYYFELDRPDLAIDDFCKAAQSGSAEGGAANRLAALCYAQLDMLKDALSFAKKAVECDSSSITSHYVLGLIYYERQQYFEAANSFSNALTRDPSDCDSLIARGRAQQAMGDYHSALLDFDRACNTEPKNATGVFYRGGLYILQHKWTLAAADFARALELGIESSKQAIATAAIRQCRVHQLRET